MMRLIRKSDPAPTSGAAVRPGRVCELGQDGLCRVETGEGHDRAFHWAVLALADAYRPAVGDRVLIAGDEAEGCYVIGVLKRHGSGRKDIDIEGPRELRTKTGARACVTVEDGREKIEVRDREDRLVFSFDVASGGATLNVAKGDLSLQAPEGFVNLVAGRGVRCFSAGEIRLESRSRVALRVRGAKGERSAGVQLSPDGALIQGEALGVKARRGEIRIEEARYTGSRLTSKVERAWISFSKLESVVGRLLSRAKNVYRKVEGIDQLEAGQVRTRVDGMHSVEAQASYHRTQGDVKIDGAHIRLG